MSKTNDKNIQSIINNQRQELGRLLNISNPINLTMEIIASFIGITRQTFSKLISEAYDIPKLSENNYEKLALFFVGEKLDFERANALINLNHQFERTLKLTPKLVNSEIDAWNDIFKYVNYWPENKDPQQRYIEKIHQHLHNFHIKTNPYYPFFREYFDKDQHPLLEFDIDYESNNVTNIYVSSLLSKDDETRLNINYSIRWKHHAQKQKYSFSTFIDKLLNFDRSKEAYLIYIDSEFSTLEYIEKNSDRSTQKKLAQLKFFDLSRLFRVSEYGHALEDILSNYNIAFNENELLGCAHYRGEKIKQLIRCVSGYNLPQKSLMEKLVNRSDSETYEHTKTQSFTAIKKRERIQKSQQNETQELY